MKPKDQLELFDGKTLRDEAIERVSSHAPDFMADGVLSVASKLQPGEYTGEDIRIFLTRLGITPHHPNAWGALTMNLIKKGLIKDTGRMVKMKWPSSHARKTSVYLKESK